MSTQIRSHLADDRSSKSNNSITFTDLTDQTALMSTIFMPKLFLNLYHRNIDYEIESYKDTLGEKYYKGIDHRDVLK